MTTKTTSFDELCRSPPLHVVQCVHSLPHCWAVLVLRDQLVLPPFEMAGEAVAKV